MRFKVIEELNEASVKSKMRKKCEDIEDDEVKLQEYFETLTLHEARERFQINCNMNKLRRNFKNMGHNKEAEWRCLGCDSEEEVNFHMMRCRQYEDDKVGLKIDTDKEINEFFSWRVIRKRMMILNDDEE